MTGYWVRDDFSVWHKVRDYKADAKGRWSVICVSLPIDVSLAGLPAAGAVICPDCAAIVEREKVG